MFMPCDASPPSNAHVNGLLIPRNKCFMSVLRCSSTRFLEEVKTIPPNSGWLHGDFHPMGSSSVEKYHLQQKTNPSPCQPSTPNENYITLCNPYISGYNPLYTANNPQQKAKLIDPTIPNHSRAFPIPFT